MVVFRRIKCDGNLKKICVKTKRFSFWDETGRDRPKRCQEEALGYRFQWDQQHFNVIHGGETQQGAQVDIGRGSKAGVKHMQVSSGHPGEGEKGTPVGDPPWRWSMLKLFPKHTSQLF